MRLMPKPRTPRRAHETGTRYLRVPVHIYLLPLPHVKGTALMNVVKAAAATGDIPDGLVGLERDAAGIGAGIHERGLHKYLDLDWAGARLANCATDSVLCVVFADNRDEPAVYVTCHSAGSSALLMLGRGTSVSTRYHAVSFPPASYYATRDKWTRDGFTEMSMSIAGTSMLTYDATDPADGPFHDFRWHGVIGGYASPHADVPGAQLISYDDMCRTSGISAGGVENHPVLHAHAVLNVREHGWYLPDSHLWKKAVEFPY